MNEVAKLHKRAETLTGIRMAANDQKEEWAAMIPEYKAYAAYYRKAAAQGEDAQGNKLSPNEIQSCFTDANYYDDLARRTQTKYDTVFNSPQPAGEGDDVY